MTQPMLSIKGDRNKPKATANLLPCRIHHDGPVDPIATYWNPTATDDGTKLAYFRGRKLQGKIVKLPEQCRGVVLERKDQKPAHPEVEAPENDDNEPAAEFGTMQVTADFDEMVIWGHEAVADAAGDPYIRSMEEWLQVADQIHAYPQGEDQPRK
ncbi:Fc.00g085720.m01.CDS01 [Cosmosporella sp. VM-42]